MFGSLLGKVVQVATCPIDIADAVLDSVTGGDGSKHSRKQGPGAILTDPRDAVVRALRELDDD